MTQYFKIFELNLKKMILKKNDSEHILQLNYAYLITCMETYFSSAMWGTLEKYPKCYSGLGKEMERSVKLSKICDKGIPAIIKEEFRYFQYHNLYQVKIYYKNAFNVEFPKDLSSIYRAIGIRHNIVHRCGFSKKNVPTNINFQNVEELKIDLITLIKDIDNQIQTI